MLAAVPNTEWTSTSVARVYSDPFGGIRGNSDADVPGDHRFLGATRDADSGLTLLGARYYDPVTGCFISVDPILNREVPAHLHAYAYGFNNPVTFSDASGLEPRDKNGNFDGDPYSSPSTTSWAYLNGCGGNLSCVGTWVGNFQVNFFGGAAEVLGSFLWTSCSLCMGASSAGDLIDASSDWDAHFAREQAKGEQFREWWSDPWNNFWRPIGEDFADNPGHLLGGTVATANLLVVPGVGGVKLLNGARAVDAVELVTVGRWMRPAELDSMIASGTIQFNAVGVHRVANPASPDTFRAAPPGDLYVEYDLPVSVLSRHSAGTSQVVGPDSLVGRNFPERAHVDVPFSNLQVRVR